jgi:hypothetical protein
MKRLRDRRECRDAAGKIQSAKAQCAREPWTNSTPTGPHTPLWPLVADVLLPVQGGAYAQANCLAQTVECER